MVKSDDFSWRDNADGSYSLPEGHVAVLLATYNGEAYLKEQLDSLRCQTFRNFVCFIHDDASSDGTPEVAAAYCGEHPGQFVYIGSSKVGGAKYNFMHLLKCIEADYIMFSDQDDVWMPEKIEKSYRKIRQTEGASPKCPVCVCADVMVTDSRLNIISESFYDFSGITFPPEIRLKDLLYGDFVVGCTMIFNRKLRKRVLSADVTSMISMHDSFIALCAKACGRLVYMNEALLLYRQHGRNAIGAHVAENFWIKLWRTVMKFNEMIEAKRDFFEKKSSNACAVLVCMETDTSSSETVRIGKQTIKKFVEQQKSSLFVKLFRLYCWEISLALVRH